MIECPFGTPKIFVTPNWVLDADLIAEAKVLEGSAAGANQTSEGGGTQTPVRNAAEVRFFFKNPEREPIILFGSEAVEAWKNFKSVVESPWDRA